MRRQGWGCVALGDCSFSSRRCLSSASNTRIDAASRSRQCFEPNIDSRLADQDPHRLRLISELSSWA